MRVVIIEDEQPAARRLARLINEVDPIAQIMITLDSVQDAVEFFRMGHNPDLIFMDIQLADGISFDIFQKTQISAPVIFTTAYDHYAVKAFKLNSVDYLLKPIEPKELSSAIQKWRDLHEKNVTPVIAYKELLQAISGKKGSYRKRFLVKSGSRLTHINIQDVAYFFSGDGNTFLVTRSDDRFILEMVLEELEESLDPEVFFRINRKMILSPDCIRKMASYFNNRFVLEIQPPFGEEILVSRQRSTAFRQWLDK
jgi:DNA-binding LytR/AlgR family response regulator